MSGEATVTFMKNMKHIWWVGVLLLALMGCGTTSTYFRDHYQGAMNGNPEDEYAIATCYDNGDGGVPGGKADKAKAAEWYLKAARKGHAKAQNNLGLLYEKGEGVPRDIDQALDWLESSALQGYKYGQYNAGRAMYDFLDSLGGIDEGEIKQHAASLNGAVKYLRLARDNGVPDAQDYINRCRKYGELLQGFANRRGVKIQLDL